MAKNILQDIVPPEKRSIRNIPVPNRKDKITPQPKVVEQKPASEYSQFPSYSSSQIEKPTESEEDTPKVYPYSDNSTGGRGFSRKAIWAACAGAILIVLVTFFSLFTGATVLVTPTQKTAQIGTETVLKAIQGQEGDGVSYEVVKISKDLGQAVTANGEEQVERKASGTIIVYNNVDKSPQRLIKNTRFETPEGLIYRISDSIVIPGQINATTPGSIEVTVIADVAGEKYNIGLTDFTVPGFKTDASRFKNIYARSKTEMTGGFIGTVKKISDTDLTKAKGDIHALLTDSLSKEVLTQVPAEFVLYPDAMFTTFESLPQSEARGNSVTINERGTLVGIMFKRSTLSQYLATILAPELVSKVPPMIKDVESIPFAFSNKSSFNPMVDSTFSFNLSGDVTFISQFDSLLLAKDLAGKPKSSLPDILKNYSSIEKIDANVRPFWKRSFPSDATDITVKVSLSK